MTTTRRLYLQHDANHIRALARHYIGGFFTRVDDDAPIVASPEHEGFYVQAWVWVSENDPTHPDHG